MNPTLAVKRFGAVALGLLAAAIPAAAQWQLTSPSGEASIKFGLLLQGQAEWLELPAPDDPDRLELSRNLFLRRTRLLFGGHLTENVSFFLDTDSPNLGKAGASGTKDSADLYLQDVMLTYRAADELKVDAGLLLLPLSHNTETSAALLLPVDYGPYSFLASAPTESRCGRDYGVQLRGILAQRVEYRAGVFQGVRGENAEAPFRYTGRVVLNFFAPEEGFFYSGVTLGAKRIAALGFSADGQECYRAYAGDFFLDLPLANGDALTLQADYIYYDGGETFAALPVQNTWLAEGGWYFHAARLSPFFQFAAQDFADPELSDEKRYQAGLAFWPGRHTFNLKAAYTRIVRDPGPERSQVVLQWQGFWY